MMKIFHTLTLAAASFCLCSLVSCDKEPAVHVHDENCNHGPTGKKAGPNGGKVLSAPDFICEFFVTKDNKVRITFLDSHHQAIPPAKQQVGIVCGDEASPTNLSFSTDTDGKSLISNGTLPSGNLYNLTITVQVSPEKKPAKATFKLDLSHCDSCNLKEYACTCEHHHHH